MLKDYDITVSTNPGKANVVADTLRHITMRIVSHVEEEKKELVKDIHRLACSGMRLEDTPNGGFMVNHNSESL